ncbi:unnamed protein product [Dibothriocephalus latus]|uniref:Uncharacterized protein n=1 Tax=Dibothriocephalus latus TaxID=60516 RepID=A0A3P6TEJ1_DIBLA|nr:unnamed protein product [Dibothriocephalus latus]
MAGEGERTAGQRVKIVRLQQKLREVTDRNESLELQVNILRRRLSEQEEPRATSPRRPATSLTNADRQRRRVTKQVEQMRAEILSLQAENLQLKAQALTENKNSLAAIGKAKVLHAAETRARELQNRCERQAEELESLRRKLVSAETSASEEKQARNEQSNSVTTQLTEYRTALDAARKTEKQASKFAIHWVGDGSARTSSVCVKTGANALRVLLGHAMSFHSLMSTLHPSSQKHLQLTHSFIPLSL